MRAIEMNFEIVLNIQWLFFILFYGCCTGNKRPEAEVTRWHLQNRNEEFEPKRSGETSRFARAAANSRQLKERKNPSNLIREHSRFETVPKLDPYSTPYSPTDQERQNWHNVGATSNRCSQFEHYEQNYCLREARDSCFAPEGNWRRKFDNGNGNQNNIFDGEADDYEYQIANQKRLSVGEDPEINDMPKRAEETVATPSGQENWHKDDRDLSEKKTTSGRLSRKLHSIERDPVAGVDAVGNSDDTESDYGTDSLPGVTRLQHDDGDSEWSTKGVGLEQVVDDYPRAIVDDGSNRYRPNWNKANHAPRRNRQEMDRSDDSRMLDKPVFRRLMLESATVDKPMAEQEMARQDERTVYRQRTGDNDYEAGDDDEDDEEDLGKLDDDDEPEVSTCNCTEVCAMGKARKESDAATEMSITTVSDEPMTSPDIEGKATKVMEEMGKKVEQNKNYEKIAKESVVESPTMTSHKGPSGKQREVYIDLKIGIKVINNGSLDENEVGPVEFRRRILVSTPNKRDDSSQQTGSLQKSSPEAPYLTDIVKAIYQLVDSNDSLRTHVAPLLPSRDSLLAKVEQQDQRSQKINDHGRPQPPRSSDERDFGGPSTVSNRMKEDHHGSVKDVTTAIDALKALLQTGAVV